jgi:tetratricopeptide (TPR) repeat protein
LAYAQIKTPAASPSATLKQTIGFTDVTIEYSRPRLRERDMFTDLTRIGEVWRTGANMSTKITFSTDIALEGNQIPAGEYSIYSIPGKNDWTIIINKKISWGTDYDEKEDFLRFSVKTQQSPVKAESLTFYFANVTENSGTLGFTWENTKVEMNLKTEVDRQIMGQIDEIMGDSEKVTTDDYYTAANYYFETNRDMGKALDWINSYLEENSDKYWSYRLKSRILAKMNKYTEAIKNAEKSIELATEAGNMDYVYNNKKSISEWKNNQR